jgi:Ser/Thr protein kinase RdoA (MazF antagonist)
MIDLGFSRLVRYEYGGKVLFGDLQSHENGKYRVKRLDGDLDQGFQITNDEHTVEKVRFNYASLSDITLTCVPVAVPATKHPDRHVRRVELSSTRRRSKGEQRAL